MNENKSIGSGAYDAPSRSVVAVQAMMTRCPLAGRRRPLVAVSRRPSVVRRGRSSTWSAATSRRTPRAGRRPYRDQRPTAPTRRRLTTLRATRVATDRTYTSSSNRLAVYFTGPMTSSSAPRLTSTTTTAASSSTVPDHPHHDRGHDAPLQLLHFAGQFHAAPYTAGRGGSHALGAPCGLGGGVE